MVEAVFYWIIGVLTVIAGIGLARGLWAMVAGSRDE